MESCCARTDHLRESGLPGQAPAAHCLRRLWSVWFPWGSSPGSPILSDPLPLPLLQELGIPLDAQLFRLALTHRSFAYEHGGIADNERLEFLGDAVLELIVTGELYNLEPALPEGRMARLRSAVVNAHALADVARSLDLGSRIRFGQGEIRTRGAHKASILADTMEALIGAVYLRHGFTGAKRLVHTLFNPLICDALNAGAGVDWKTSLQELAAAVGAGPPEYLVTESGPDHAKVFSASVIVGDQTYGPGESTTKRHAEQQAAQAAYQRINADKAQ